MRSALILGGVLLGLASATLVAQQSTTQPANTPTTRPAPSRTAVPLIEPTQSPDDDWGRGSSHLLRREGEFVIKRHGKLVAAADGKHQLFAFDNDGSTPAKAGAMVMLPNRTLEEMENYLRERGDQPVVLSGQITVYRGANYLMVTSWEPAGVATTQPRE
jgi:hypothetical protein